MATPEQTTHIVTLAESRHETPELGFVRLGADPGALGYRVPGQYVKLELGESPPPSMFAIASHPGDGHLELILKRGAPFVEALLALAAGSQLRSSAAQGKGFPIDAARGKDLYLFAVGSGLAPIRAVLGTVARERSAFGEVTLYEGQRTAEHFGWQRDRTAWHDAKIRVVEVASRPDHAWKKRTGYVQTALLEDRPQLSPDRSIAFLCGMKTMVTEVRETLDKLGLPKEATHLNY